jgi:hypothetical protein
MNFEIILCVDSQMNWLTNNANKINGGILCKDFRAVWWKVTIKNSWFWREWVLNKRRTERSIVSALIYDKDSKDT